uniref:Uncharacterized protein n=1 Tax=Anguilla anguilla TaxID=7936 RepID=A0A0E9V8Z4_ANGAN
MDRAEGDQGLGRALEHTLYSPPLTTMSFLSSVNLSP